MPYERYQSPTQAHIDAAAPGRVWVPADFSHLGGRDAVDKALQRLVAAGQLRRIDRSLYGNPPAKALHPEVEFSR